MDYLDEKIKMVFPDESVFKSPENAGLFTGFNLPSFVKDWLIKKFSDDAGRIDEYSLKNFIHHNLAYKDISGTIMAENKEMTLLARIIVEPDIKHNIIRFSVPDAELKMNECRVPERLAQENPELRGGEIWGIFTLSYNVPDNDHAYIELKRFKSFKPYMIDFDYFSSKRENFTLQEWVDFLIKSMEYNPNGFDSFSQKLLFISRLLVFVEPNLNLMELAPKGTGKSYIFSNLSKYGWIISGGSVTRAKLFYDKRRESSGLIEKYSFLALDEISTIKFSNENEILGALKSYLEDGSFRLEGYEGKSSCGLIVLGNLPLDNNKKPKNEFYMKDINKLFTDSALLDRFHGFIEGWNLPRMREELKINGYGLNVEYFSEILNEMRKISDFREVVQEVLEIPPKSDTRDTEAILKITTAYLKLLFPNVRTVEDLDKEMFKEYCLGPAIKMRGIIKNQISLIDDEITNQLPAIKIKEDY